MFDLDLMTDEELYKLKSEIEDRRNKSCVYCGEPAEYLCDYIIGFNSSDGTYLEHFESVFTCDAPLCKRHRIKKENIILAAKNLVLIQKIFVVLILYAMKDLSQYQFSKQKTLEKIIILNVMVHVFFKRRAMRIEQGVKVFRTKNSQYEDLQGNEIVIVEGYDDKYDSEFFQLRMVENGGGIISFENLKTLRMGMSPRLKNTELYYEIICDCYDLDIAIKIAKMLNEDLKRGEV